MALVLAIGYVLLIAAIGCVVLCCVRFGRAACPHPAGSAIETCGLILLLGAGTTALILLFASLCGVLPSRSLLGVLALLAGVSLLVLRRRGALIRPQFRFREFQKRDWFLVLPGALLVLAVVVVSLDAVGLPLYEWDGFAIWGLKAKVVYFATLKSSPDYFHDATLAFSHHDYPLLQPFLTAGLYAAIGHVDDRLGKIVLPALYAGFACLMYTALRWRLRRFESLFLTAIALALPVLVRWAGTGYADAPLTIFYAGSVFFLVKWLAERKQEDLILAGLFSVFMASTKNEGLALAGINIVVSLFFLLARGGDDSSLRIGRHSEPHEDDSSPPGPGSVKTHPKFAARDFRSWIGFLLLVSLPLLPWLLWSRHLPRAHELSVSRAFHQFANVPIVIKAFIVEMLQAGRWSGLWFLLPLAAGLGWRAFRFGYVQALWALLLAHLGLYLYAYTATAWDLQDLLTHSLDRVLLHATPPVILLIGYHWKFVQGRPAKTRPWSGLLA